MKNYSGFEKIFFVLWLYYNWFQNEYFMDNFTMGVVFKTKNAKNDMLFQKLKKLNLG